MPFYPAEVQQRSQSPQRCGEVTGENATGKDASFVCGSYAGFSLCIEQETKKISAAGFQTNGCGFMVSTADVLAEYVEGRLLLDLHGFNKSDLLLIIDEKLGVFDETRRQCANCCIEALRVAFADYRTRQIEEFRGEKALICTCFGVTEERIEMLIDERSLSSVDEVTQVCNAGAGCGSCLMLIQEIIDAPAQPS